MEFLEFNPPPCFGSVAKQGGGKLKTPPDPKFFGPAGQKHGILDLFRTQ